MAESPMPARFARLIDRVCELDREYFKEHHGKTEYIRPFVPGEFWPDASLVATHVRVEFYEGEYFRQMLVWIPEPEKADSQKPGGGQ